MTGIVRIRERNTIRLADCFVKTTMDVIRGKWKPSIIKALRSRALGYGELRRAIPEATKKVLTAHLRELERDQIISRTVFYERIIRVEYELTSYGLTLLPVIEMMHVWGERHRKAVQAGSANLVAFTEVKKIGPGRYEGAVRM